MIEAARIAREEGLDLDIIGVDLAGMFRPIDPGMESPSLVEASLRGWQPGRSFDLVTCVHALHYVGDKLGLVARAGSCLAEDGQFAASLDVHSLKAADGRSIGGRLAADLRRAGLAYDRRRRLLTGRGPRTLNLPYRYLGADDQAGPNYTGQPAVDSYYAIPERSRR